LPAAPKSATTLPTPNPSAALPHCPRFLSRQHFHPFYCPLPE
jgi:hypothetical protein